MGNRRKAIKAKYVTDMIRHAMTMNYSKTGTHALEISACSLRAGGAMAILCV
jgi:hypothetical protein